MEITEPWSKDELAINEARRTVLDEMREARRGLTVHDSELLKHYCSELLASRIETERLQDQERLREKQYVGLLREQRHQYETLIRGLRATLRAQAKYIERLEQRRPAASGKQLWLADDFGRHNLTQDFTAERTEARLGASPWLQYGV